MSDPAVYLLLACILSLAGFSAYRVAKRVQLVVSVKFGRGSLPCAIAAFIISFAFFSVSMLVVFGVFFGR